VHRAVTDTILDRFRQGHKKLCLHGQGGEGKTTVLQDLIGILPPGSVIIAYDCYGGGSYLNSDSYRHRPQDAFLQMANDACSALLLPLLSTRDRDAD
jgi:Mg-chelatase subunit ChlI